MSILLLSVYALTTAVFIPLFLLIIFKMRRDYKIMFEGVKCKLITLFIVFILFLLLRFGVYIDMKYWKIIKYETTLSTTTEIPFYISEIIITLTISYVLYTVSKVNDN